MGFKMIIIFCLMLVIEVGSHLAFSHWFGLWEMDGIEGVGEGCRMF